MDREDVLEAAFADSLEGRGMDIIASRWGRPPRPFLGLPDHPALVFVTDRRIAKPWPG